MGFIGKLGNFFRWIALFWCAGAVMRILFAMGSDNMLAVRIHLALLVVGIMLFALATFVRNRWGSHGIRSIAASSKASWWRASIAFRSCAFIGAVWVGMSFFWQASYQRDYLLVFGPAFGLLAAYWAFSWLVIGSSNRTRAEGEQLSQTPLAVEQAALSETETESTPKERERMMRELVQRLARKE